MPCVLAILEDNIDRRSAMADCLTDRFSQYPIRFFVTAAEMIAFLRERRSDVLAIALDHDLELVPVAGSRTLDAGTGRDVVDFLASQTPFCQVVIHTTNDVAGCGMETELQDAGWTTSRITPYGDLEWIPEAWFPRMRNAVVQSVVTGTTKRSSPIGMR